jgi:hypothetical protein
MRKDSAMPWKKHEESGEEVRSIRDWPFMKSKDRDGGGIEIIYGGNLDTSEQKNHGHYGEDGNGNPDPANRSPKT